ncbi:MAG TPA: alpha-ketoglutarate-dependent dioxygenase AlkB [Mucilaginibacter sp.]|jgi:alkylated DNA repair dioxygenase AlkB
MEQLNIFGEVAQTVVLPLDLLEYHPGIFNKAEANKYMSEFISNIPWQQRIVTMYGKPIITPRLTAWYGDTGTDYTFSGTKFDPLPWTKDLLQIRKTVEAIADIGFNSVLLNYYRDGNDSVAWHSDDENELGINPVIASVSFGQARSFDIRNKADHNKKYSVNLESGSLLLMKGDLQHNWEHRIAKSTRPLKGRVNLTFRVINK